MRRAVFMLAAMATGACATPPTAVRNPGAAQPPSRSVAARPSASPPPASKTAAAPSARKQLLLYDGGSNQKDPPVRNVGKAEAQKLIDTLYPKHLSKLSQCPLDSSSSLKQARAQGEFVPRVLGAAEGSFTAAGAKERLYLVFVGECGASHADNFGSNELVVVRSGKVVDRISISGGTSIDRVIDFDGDGRDELVLGSGSTGQGDTVESVSLVRIGPGALQTIKDFGQVLDDNCGGMFTPRRVKYSVIRATLAPGQAPRFKVEKKSRPCR